MNKLVEILRSWGIQLNPNEKQSKLAEERIAICDTCEHKRTSPTIHCSVCGCLLKSKIFSPVENACPEGKWAEVDKRLSKEIKELADQIPEYVPPPSVPDKQATPLDGVKFICAQPATLYYAWQVEVMIENFLEMGVNPSAINIVCALDETNTIPNYWFKLIMKHNLVKYYFYPDTRQSKNYVSSIRPNILKQHWERNPDLVYSPVFYHDCDIVFTRPVKDWLGDDMIMDSNWYGSDCNSYLSFDYIESKGSDILNSVCSIANIPREKLLDNNYNNIGAQYLLKYITQNFWADVERDSENLFRDITEINNIKNMQDPTYIEMQIWCADMWAILFNGWKRGANTIVHGNLSFSWATDDENSWYRNNIFHNAGVLEGSVDLFSKSNYMDKLPYNEIDTYVSGTAGKKYWELVQKTGETSSLLD